MAEFWGFDPVEQDGQIVLCYDDEDDIEDMAGGDISINLRYPVSDSDTVEKCSFVCPMASVPSGTDAASE